MAVNLLNQPIGKANADLGRLLCKAAGLPETDLVHRITCTVEHGELVKFIIEKSGEPDAVIRAIDEASKGESV